MGWGESIGVGIAVGLIQNGLIWLSQQFNRVKVEISEEGVVTIYNKKVPKLVYDKIVTHCKDGTEINWDESFCKVEATASKASADLAVGKEVVEKDDTKSQKYICIDKLTQEQLTKMIEGTTRLYYRIQEKHKSVTVPRSEIKKLKAARCS